ncbi:hypothetical protein JCM10213_009075 [Rhodosporidiobolus nylandii]
MAPSSGAQSFSASSPVSPYTSPFDPDTGAGSGAHLPPAVLLTATLSAGLSTILSLWTVWLQLKHYHKPRLQRMVVRILVMVPIYSLSSLISLYSLDAAYFVDAVRDVYEAFVIYCFFSLLVEYLGGERSLLITLHGRPPHPHPAPVGWCLSPMDASDPFTFLGLKRGILQYVQVKPLLAGITVVLKALGKYEDGHLAKDSGYTYISIAYNVSVSLSLYCLAMFWVATHDDLKPYRPMPKFLCVKGIIFFSFWQSFAVSILVALGWIRSHRYETEQLSLAIQDTLICLEMPLFAFLHLYAFSYTDYIDDNHVYSGRLPVFHAFKDAFGYKDLLLDSLTTVRGTGFNYRTFEPASGALHAQGLIRDRRIAAGLRYSTRDGKKYWLDMPRGSAPGHAGEAYTRQGLQAGLASRPIHEIHRRLERRVEAEEGYAPLSHDEEVFHVDRSRAEDGARRKKHWWERHREYDELSDGDSDGASEAGSLDFHGPPEEEEGEQGEGEKERREEEWREMEQLYGEAKELEYGDWSYPVIDASRETARRRRRDEEEAILSGRFWAHGSRRKDKGKQLRRPGATSRGSYGALAERTPRQPSPTPSRSSSRDPSDPPTSADHPAPSGSEVLAAGKNLLTSVLPFTLSRPSSSTSASSSTGRPHLPPDAVDLVVEDLEAEEEEQIRQRRRGEPGTARTRVYKVAYKPRELEDAGELRKGEELPVEVEGIKAEVKDVMSPSSSPSLGRGDEVQGETEAVRVSVHEEEQTMRQAGVDEDEEEQRQRSRQNPLLPDGVDEADNPWK